MYLEIQDNTIHITVDGTPGTLDALRAVNEADLEVPFQVIIRVATETRTVMENMDWNDWRLLLLGLETAYQDVMLAADRDRAGRFLQDMKRRRG